MTTLTKSTGRVTLTGSAEKVTLPAAYGWVWLKNMSDADMFAGLSADISEGADGVMVIPAGECGRIQTDGFNSIYLMGTGNALVVAQNYADCPFKVGGKGGEIPDLSAYAKKTDVPNIKVNAAVGADNVGGKLPEKIFYENGMSSDLDSATKSGCYAASPDTLNAPFSMWWLVDTMNYNDGQFIVQKAHAMGDTAVTISYIRNYANNGWSDWTEIYTAGNKPYVTGSATVEANTMACVTNHGFMPSAAIWWNQSKFGMAISVSTTDIVTGWVVSDKTVLNYMIFK